MSCHVAIPVSDASQIGEARRAALRAAEEAGLNETDIGRAGIIASELATNLARHARPGGQFLVVADRQDDRGAVEITAIDNGPGMADVSRCLQDGFSTGGTPGNGLGAVRRLSDQLDIHSGPSGTVIWARVECAASAAVSAPRHFSIAAVSVPAPGEIVCGDAWCVARQDSRIALFVIDGLGHGALAAEAANIACQVFNAKPFGPPHQILESAHTAMSRTRGAAAAVVQIDAASALLHFAGVGNISATLLSGLSRRGLASHNGIVGHQMRRVQEFQYPWDHQSLLILHSDGLQTKWQLDQYPGLTRRHPGVIAGVLYRDFKRGRDDATVAVIAPHHQQTGSHD